MIIVVFLKILNIDLIYADNYFDMMAEESNIKIQEGMSLVNDFFKANKDHSGSFFQTKEDQEEYNKKYIDSLRLKINQSSKKDIKTYFFSTDGNFDRGESFLQKRLIDSGNLESPEFKKLKTAFESRYEKNILDELDKNNNMHCFASSSPEYYSYQLSNRSSEHKPLQAISKYDNKDYEFKTEQAETRVIYGYSPISLENIYSPAVWNLFIFDCQTENLMGELLMSNNQAEFNTNKDKLDDHIKNNNVLIKLRASLEETMKYIYTSYRKMWEEYFYVAKSMQFEERKEDKTIVIHSSPIGQGCFLSLIKDTPFALYFNQALIGAALDAAVKHKGKINISDGNSLNTFGNFAQNYFENIGNVDYKKYLDLEKNDFFAKPSDSECTFYLIPGDPNALPGGNLQVGPLKDKSFESLSLGLPSYGIYPEIVFPNVYHMRYNKNNEKVLLDEKFQKDDYNKDSKNFFYNLSVFYETNKKSQAARADQKDKKSLGLLAYVKNDNIENSYYFPQEEKEREDEAVELKSIYEYVSIELYIPEKSNEQRGRGGRFQSQENEEAIHIRLVFDEEKFYAENKLLFKDLRKQSVFNYDEQCENCLVKNYDKSVESLSKRYSDDELDSYKKIYIDLMKSYIKKLCENNNIAFIDTSEQPNKESECKQEQPTNEKIKQFKINIKPDNKLFYKISTMTTIERFVLGGNSERQGEHPYRNIKESNLFNILTSICYKMTKVTKDQYEKDDGKFAKVTSGSEVFKSFCQSMFADVEKQARRDQLQRAALNSLEFDRFFILGGERDTNDVCSALDKKVYGNHSLLGKNFEYCLDKLLGSGRYRIRYDYYEALEKKGNIYELYAYEHYPYASNEHIAANEKSSKYNMPISVDDCSKIELKQQKLDDIEDEIFEYCFNTDSTLLTDDKNKDRVRLLFCGVFSVISAMISYYYDKHYGSWGKKEFDSQIYHFPKEIINTLRHERGKMMSRYAKYKNSFCDFEIKILNISNKITNLIELMAQDYPLEQYIELSQKVRDTLLELSEAVGGVVIKDTQRVASHYYSVYLEQFEKEYSDRDIYTKFESSNRAIYTIESSNRAIYTKFESSKNKNFLSKYKWWFLSGAGVVCLALLYKYYYRI